MRAARLALPLLAIAALLPGLGACGEGERDPNVLRVGHFPNVTHAHGLIGHHRTRTGRGWFEERLGAGKKVEWRVYNAGPSAMEALLAGSIDLTYVGPNPALNAHVKSGGDEIRVLAGATRGGSALVVRPQTIRSPADLRGRRVATPQFGNTQDVAMRAWLAKQGFHVTQTGGDVTVVPTANPEQVALFARGDVDAVWTVEPWVSRIEAEAGGKVFLEEESAVTTVLVGSAKCLRERPDLVRTFVAAHRELTAWLKDHPDEARAEVRAELRDETRVDLAEDLAARAWKRMRFDDAIARADFEAFVKQAQSVGFLKDAISLERLVETP